MIAAHKDRAHSIISPSGAHRWYNCTPSAMLEQQFPDTTSEAALEGTLAHEVSEAKLRHYFDTENYSKRKLSAALRKFKAHELWQPEMDGYTDTYLDTVRGIALAATAQPTVLIETRLDLSMIAPGMFGTADFILIHGDELHVIDFKYGKGVRVEAEDNLQMQLYGIGAMYRYKILYPIRVILTTICQPRLDHVSTAEYTADQLEAKAKLLHIAADLALKGEGSYKAGDWCRFCRARAQCRARAEENVRLAGFKDRKPPLISNDEIGHYLKLGEDVAAWLKDLQAFALSECLAGRDVAGWKAVAGRALRKWSDQEAAFAAVIGSGVDEALLYERVPISLAQTEKLMGKKAFEAVAGQFVERPPGKPTLVPETDKREAISNVVSAAEAFAE